MKCLKFPDKDCDLLTCQTKRKCLWHDEYQETKQSKIKVLSILQPWASLCVTIDPKTGRAAKQIETRSWNTKYRGELLIHASAGKQYLKISSANEVYKKLFDNYNLVFNKPMQELQDAFSELKPICHFVEIVQHEQWFSIIGQMYGEDTNLGDTDVMAAMADIKYTWFDAYCPKINNIE